MSDEFKPLEISPLAHRMHNPIRALVDQMVLDPNPKLEYIRLSLGDPTVYGNYPIHNHVNQSVMNAISSGDFNGYGPAHGLESARRAVAEYCSTDTIKLTADDCFITNGASGAIEIAILTFCSKTKKLYIPSPGFILYKALCVVYDIPYEFYKCDPNNNWEIDLQDLENKMKTSEVEPGMILICNPSNPTGSCFSRQHLTDICDLAGKYSLPILADEIYSNMNFEGKFTWTAECSKKSPVISVGGIAKRYF